MPSKIPLSYHQLRKPSIILSKPVQFPQGFLRFKEYFLLVIIAFIAGTLITGLFLPQKVAGIDVEPNSTPLYYLTLAKIYTQANDYNHAQEALLIARDLGASAQTINSVKSEIDENIHRKRLAEESLLVYQNKVSLNPSWRDGWLEVARYAYMLNQDNLAKSALESAYKLDPNYPPAQEFRRILN